MLSAVSSINFLIPCMIDSVYVTMDSVTLFFILPAGGCIAAVCLEFFFVFTDGPFNSLQSIQH